MEISGAEDQQNSMMEDMVGVNQSIKNHNDALKQKYEGMITTAQGQFGQAKQATTDKGIEEATLNVGAKGAKAVATYNAVKASGRNYFTSQEAWGKGPSKVAGGIKKGVGSAQSAVQSAGSDFQAGSAGTTSNDPMSSEFAQGGDNERPSVGETPEASGGLGDVNINEDYSGSAGVSAPSSSTDMVVRPSSNPAGSTDASSTGTDATNNVGGDGSTNAPQSEGGSGAGSAGGSEAGAVDAAADAGGDAVGDMVKKGLGHVGGIASKVGTTLSVIGGVDDLTQDISAGKIVGNNAGEKAGNVLGIMAGATDAISEAVPIFAPLGAAFGLFSAISSGIGEIEDKDKKVKEAKDDLAGKGKDPDPNQAQVSAPSLQAQGLIASQGAPTATQQASVGTGSF